MRRTITALLVAATLVTVTACGDDDDATSTTDGATTEAPDTSAPSDAASGDTADLVIAEFSFGEPLTVAAGTTVTVRNNDSTAHTFTADDDSFDSGTLGVGETFEITFDEPGTFTFHCNIHTTMTGTITVTA